MQAQKSSGRRIFGIVQPARDDLDELLRGVGARARAHAVVLESVRVCVRQAAGAALEQRQTIYGSAALTTIVADVAGLRASREHR